VASFNEAILDYVRLKNLVFFAYHGVTAEEVERGQRFEVDVELGGDFSAAGQSDDLRDAIDYAHVLNLVSGIVTKSRFNLIEALAEAIADTLLKEYPDTKVKVVVRKPEAPLPGKFDYAEVEINRPSTPRD